MKGRLPMISPRSPRAAADAVLPVIGASLIGWFAAYPNLKSWYRGLVKPEFTPPERLFGPVWAVLYALMAVAAWRILSLPSCTPGRRAALRPFFIQLALNAAWPGMFFALRSPLAGLVNIGPQELAILATIARLRRLDRAAAAYLVPLAVWVAFASLLNFEIWRLNGQDAKPPGPPPAHGRSATRIATG